MKNAKMQMPQTARRKAENYSHQLQKKNQDAIRCEEKNTKILGCGAGKENEVFCRGEWMYKKNRYFRMSEQEWENWTGFLTNDILEHVSDQQLQ